MKLVANPNRIPTKICAMCGERFPATLEFFYKGKIANKFGLNARCKKCSRITSKKSTEKNLDHIKEYRIKYRERNRDAISEYRRNYHKINAKKEKEYRKLNEDKLRHKHHLYYLNNKEACMLRHKKWRENNRDVDLMLKQRYKARKRSLMSSFSVQEWENCLRYFNNSCAYCGSKFKTTPHQDHFIPVRCGGDYVAENILPACKSCNTSKRSSDYVSWYIGKSFYSEVRLRKIYDYFMRVMISRRTADIEEDNRNENVGSMRRK